MPIGGVISLFWIDSLPIYDRSNPANVRETGNDNAAALVVDLVIGVVNAAGQEIR